MKHSAPNSSRHHKYRLLLLCLGLLLSGSSISGQVFVDSFSNGTVADSDLLTGFWITNLNNGSGDANALIESAGTLSMSAGDNDGTNNANFSGVSLTSSVSSNFNFFSDSLTFKVRGISFSGSTAPDKQQIRMSLTSTAQSSYNSPDAVVVRVRGDGTILLGSKVDTINSNSDGTTTHESVDVGSDNVITGFDFNIGPVSGTTLSYTLTAFGGGGTTQSGSFTLDPSDWDGVGGNAALTFWAQEFNATGGNDNYTVTLDSIEVSSPEPPTPPVVRTRYLPTGNYNVLFIAFDDLKANFGPFVTADLTEAMPKPVTPNLDTLASTGMSFTRTYCQQAVCWASRTSLLTGCRPDTTKIWDDGPNFRDTMPGVITLPQHFANQGFNVAGYGKIYDFRSTPPQQDAALSWPDGFSSPGVSNTNSGNAHHFYEEGQWQVEQAEAEGSNTRRALFSTDAGETNYWVTPNRPVDRDIDYADGLITGAGIAKLNQFATDYINNGNRFFLAIGMQKPHLPFTSPKTFWDLYDPDEIDLTGYDGARTSPTGGLAFADATYEIGSYGDLNTTVAEADARRLIHGYLATTSFVDYQLGRILSALEASGVADETIIVIWGDHGFHLGDHNGYWAKHTCFENATRSPLVILAPGMSSLGTDGAVCPTPVELVDIYPTLVDLANIPTPTQPGGFEAEGTSLRPLLEDPAQPWKKAAFSQYQRNISGSGIANPGNGMGYTLRTTRYRYTEWWRTQTSNQSGGGYTDRDVKLYSSPEFVELYDHEEDPFETVNLADDPAYSALRSELSTMLAGGTGWNTTAVEAPAEYPVEYATWRDAHAVPGIDALLDLDPNADPDFDLLVNLFEYKMGSHPLLADQSGLLPVIEDNEGESQLAIYFNSVPSRTDVSLVAQHSQTLAPGSFTESGVDTSTLSTTSGREEKRASVPVITGEQDFLRLNANSQ